MYLTKAHAQRNPQFFERMASSTWRFYCDLCQLGFHFSSKYQLHLQSSNHRTLEEIVNKVPPSDVQTKDPISVFNEVCPSPKGI